jgi:hypothetical protein
MPDRTTKRDLEGFQLAAILTALAEKPGLTAYALGICVPVAQPVPAELIATARSAPPTLVLHLLGQLEKSGRVRMEPDPKGNRWYLTDAVTSCGPLNQCARTGHVDRLPGQHETEETPSG